MGCMFEFLKKVRNGNVWLMRGVKRTRQGYKRHYTTYHGECFEFEEALKNGLVIKQNPTTLWKKYPFKLTAKGTALLEQA